MNTDHSPVGSLGDNYASGINSRVPVAVDKTGALNGLSIKQISAGYFHTCAIASNNRVYCWGFNKFGQLGNGNDGDNSSMAPYPVATDDALKNKAIKYIDASYEITCAIDSDGKVYCRKLVPNLSVEYLLMLMLQ